MSKKNKSLSFLSIGKEERQKFLQYTYAEDKHNFSMGALVGALLNFIFIPIEYARIATFDTAFVFRVATVLLYLTAYFVVKNYKGSVSSFQVFSASTIVSASLFCIANDYYADVYALYLANVLLALIFFLYILSGLYFSLGLVVNVVILALFTLYAWGLGKENKFFQELPDLLSLSLLAAYAGYLVQKNRYDRYQQSLLIEKQYAQIRKEHEEYQKLNTVKDRLLSILSHDVRSPLDSLQGFVHLLENKLLNKEEIDELLPALKAKLSRTTEFVGHTLLWTKNQIGGFSPHLRMMNVKDLLQKTIELYEHHLQEKNLQITMQCAHDLHIKADEEMAYIVARNLLNNAIKFTPRDKAILLLAAENKSTVTISVIDEGIGITDEQIEHIFNIIHQPSLGTRGEKGTGLGLSLSKEFMEKIGGDLMIESNHPQAGTTCHMIFPKA